MRQPSRLAQARLGRASYLSTCPLVTLRLRLIRTNTIGDANQAMASWPSAHAGLVFPGITLKVSDYNQSWILVGQQQLNLEDRRAVV